MKSIITLLSILVLASAYNSRREYKDEFQLFKAKHGKTYSKEEDTIRFVNFVASHQRVKNLNERAIKGGSSARYGLNLFSDLTPAEFRNQFLMAPTKPQKAKDVVKTKKTALPDFFDWRNHNGVTAVKDQEQCGSCWAFSATENIESVLMVQGKQPSIPALSPQQIVDCDPSDGGCNGGNPYTAFEYVIGAGGMERNVDYPYTGQNGNCAFDNRKVVAKISGWKDACGWEDESGLKATLVNYAAPSICVDAANWQDYQGGIMTGWECAWVNELDHCVQAVGYNMTGPTPYWIVRNSWSTGWGESGYIRLQYGDNACGLTTQAPPSTV